MAVASALIGATAAIGGGLLGSSSAKSAARTQAAAQQAGIDEQRRQYDTTRADLAPWREAGANTLGDLVSRLPELTSAPTGFETSPGYQFRYDEGRRAVEGSAAARGMSMSGGALKDLVRFGQGTASAEYGDWWNRERGVQGDTFNRLASIANVGQTATNQTGQFGAQASGNIANMISNQGDARAYGQLGSASAWSGALGSLSQIAQNQFSSGYQNPYASVSAAHAANPGIF